MGKIDLCFVWHMHQPFYKDLVTGEYKLPWTRLHGLKDYYGMVEILGEFPTIRQTFNLVPSMLEQLEEYAQGKAQDPFLRLALKPAEELTAAEQGFMLRYFFQANVDNLIYRYPRYSELYEANQRAAGFFGPQEFRDLQVLSQLAWFDEFFFDRDPKVQALAAKGRQFTLEDQQLMGAKQLEILGEVLPVYRKYAATGQIEISTTPYYHPILPLLCDSDVAQICHPHVPLPTRFQYPEDARYQLQKAREYMKSTLGLDVKGLWPSEGSVSDAAMQIAAECGFTWFATDNGVLARTLQRDAGTYETYRPYLWKQSGQQMHCIFRDHYLSDLVGFVYSKMGPAEAAEHFLHRIRENCSGRDALVPVILDGENAWEYFPRSGRQFLRELYGRIAADPNMEAITLTEAFARHTSTEINHIFPGSWINANFDVWIGAEEDNRAWEYLLRARRAFDKYADTVPADRRALAYEELLIAEGSDWCWWYGPEHDSANRPEFDQLFRDHLANVYRALGQPAPEELAIPILKLSVQEFHQRPTGRLKVRLDGKISSYFEWMGAGEYRVDARQGAMHGNRLTLETLFYGTDGENLLLRLDFGSNPDFAKLVVGVKANGLEVQCDRSQFAAERILECAIPLSQLAVQTEDWVSFQVTVWLDGLPMEALPANGQFQLDTANPSEW